MKRGELAPEELDGVIKLKKLGTSWLRIQHETGINRRTAKRAYERWEHRQSPEVIREARKEVLAVEFRHHIEDLKSLAISFALNSNVPSSPDITNAGQFFTQLWSQDILQRFGPADQPPLAKWDRQFGLRENELLFQSLQDHICAEEGRWGALEQWKEARNNSAKILDKLQKESQALVANYLKLERETNLLRIIKEKSHERDPVKQMAEAALYAIWQDILGDKLGQNLVKTVSGSRGSQSMVKVGYETFFLFDDKDGHDHMARAQTLTSIISKAIYNLENGMESDTVKSLQNKVRTMKGANEKFREMLNPVKLMPMILRTRCELCPA